MNEYRCTVKHRHANLVLECMGEALVYNPTIAPAEDGGFWVLGRASNWSLRKFWQLEDFYIDHDLLGEVPPLRHDIIATSLQ